MAKRIEISTIDNSSSKGEGFSHLFDCYPLVFNKKYQVNDWKFSLKLTAQRVEEKEIMKPEKKSSPSSIAEGELSNKVATRLVKKNYSPLLVRKYQVAGWPLFVGIICDGDLSDLDSVVWSFYEQNSNATIDTSIQEARNFVGGLSERIISHYHNKNRGSVEGVAVFYYIDKCALSSLYGDFMVHKACRDEFYLIINTLPHI